MMRTSRHKQGPSVIPADIGDRVAYDPVSGVLTWRRSGKVAGSSMKSGYLRLHLDHRFYLAHRVAYFLMTGEQPSIVDHVDTNPANNCWSNLRVADPSESAANRKPTGKLYPKGVTPSPSSSGRFRASIRFRNVRRHIGTFDTVEEAHDAYRRAASEVHGAFARPE